MNMEKTQVDKSPDQVSLRFQSIDEYNNEINRLMKLHSESNDVGYKEQIELKMDALRGERAVMTNLKERAEAAAKEKAGGEIVVRGPEHRDSRETRGL